MRGIQFRELFFKLTFAQINFWYFIKEFHLFFKANSVPYAFREQGVLWR